MAALETPAEKPNSTRAFGRYQLRQLLGKSNATMAWLAFDPQATQEVVLHMPRVQPVDAPALKRWLEEAQMATRLDHPHLARAIDIAVQDHWPYLVVDRNCGQTLAEWMLSHPKTTPGETVDLICQALESLAYAHDAGVVHGDLQLHHLFINQRGHVSVAGFDMVVEPSEDEAAARHPAASSRRRGVKHENGLDRRQSQARRELAERDTLAISILLHHLLSGKPALDEADTAQVIDRLPPVGREIVRLPWDTAYPIAEALRTIVNRATDRQPRKRYLNARTLFQALKGWRETDAKDTGGPVALLLDRLQTIGHLPALPQVGTIVAHLSLVEGQRTDEIAQQILQDMALSFELLRQANSAHVRSGQVSGNGPVLTIRRTVALVGINGVRKAAASLRTWPGPLNAGNAAALHRLMQRVRLAGHTAQALCPPGYDAEVIYLITVLQNLGRLMLQYHFTEEAGQLRGLMQNSAPVEAGSPELPGMSEEGASFAVLGMDIESLGIAVARQWGLADEVLHMIHRLSVSGTVRAPGNDADMLRAMASAANEAVDAVTLLPAQKVSSGIAKVALRYSRALGISTKDFNHALQEARAALDTGAKVSALKNPPAYAPENDAPPVTGAGFDRFEEHAAPASKVALSQSLNRSCQERVSLPGRSPPVQQT